MQAFARQRRDERLGQWFATSKLSGFCLLVKRAVYESLGGLDERFGLGLFDDGDLAERARRAGFELAVAHDLFVHHFGSRTFAGAGIDAKKLLQENSDRFSRKWGMSDVGQRVALRPWIKDGNGPQISQMDADETTRKSGNPEANGHQTEPAARPGAFHLRSSAKSADKTSPISVSLTMIVRDEETYISKCLSSVAGLFDEIVVVDRGSKDLTREIAREFGARVFDFVWVYDFPRPATRRWLGPRGIMRSGSMPMMWLIRPSGKSCGSCWTGCRAAGVEAEALRWASRGRSTHPTSRAG